MNTTVATRRSALALAQCRALMDRLRAAHPGIAIREEHVVTSGDRIQDRPLADIGGKGLFVKEIEEALLEGRADFAVHSIKDVPGALPSGLAIVCVPSREDPRDALIAPKFGSLASLPSGARVGTSSLRRIVHLRAARPDLVFLPMRGNVDTRLAKLERGDCDAIVLACAGLNRLGLASRATEILSPEVSLPAVGQGALGVEARESDDVTRGFLSALHDAPTATCVAAERGVLLAVGGDCKTPLAAYAERVSTPSGDSLRLRAMLSEPDGSRRRTAERTWPWPASEAAAAALGVELGGQLLAEG